LNHVSFFRLSRSLSFRYRTLLCSMGHTSVLFTYARAEYVVPGSQSMPLANAFECAKGASPKSTPTRILRGPDVMDSLCATRQIYLSGRFENVFKQLQFAVWKYSSENWKVGSSTCPAGGHLFILPASPRWSLEHTLRLRLHARCAGGACPHRSQRRQPIRTTR
jgi:hypothetical protein